MGTKTAVRTLTGDHYEQLIMRQKPLAWLVEEGITPTALEALRKADLYEVATRCQAELDLAAPKKRDTNAHLVKTITNAMGEHIAKVRASAKGKGKLPEANASSKASKVVVVMTCEGCGKKFDIGKGNVDNCCSKKCAAKVKEQPPKPKQPLGTLPPKRSSTGKAKQQKRTPAPATTEPHRPKDWPTEFNGIKLPSDPRKQDLAVLQELYLQVVGRTTSAVDKGYIVTKIQKVVRGEARVGASGHAGNGKRTVRVTLDEELAGDATRDQLQATLLAVLQLKATRKAFAAHLGALQAHQAEGK